MPTLSLGYLTTPVSIEASVYANQYEISPSSVLSIIGFGPTPIPTHMSPTMAKFILTIESAGTLTMAQKELFALLYESLNTNSYGIIPLSDRHVGILLPHVSSLQQQEPSYQFILQIASIPHSSSQQDTTMNNNRMVMNDTVPPFDSEYLKHLPIQVMELCQNRQEDQLRIVAREIYKIAAVYGYWDLWLVLEGICTRFQINPQQLVQ